MVVEKIKQGDLFVVKTSGFIPWAIRVVQWFWSTDNESTYNHAGVIVSRLGTTIEAKWRISRYHLRDIIGKQTMVVRHKDMTTPRFLLGYRAIKPMIGKLYPVWRLPLHLLRISKFFAFGPGVCSELTAKFMDGACFHNIVYGLTPDDLADRWRIDKDMIIIFEGILTRDVYESIVQEGL